MLVREEVWRSQHLIIGDTGQHESGGTGVDGQASQPFLYIFFFFLRKTFFFSFNPVCCKAGRQAVTVAHAFLHQPNKQA